MADEECLTDERRADHCYLMAPASARWRQDSRTNDGQMIKDPTAATSDQALDLLLH